MTVNEETEVEWGVERSADDEITITVADDDEVLFFTMGDLEAALLATAITNVLTGGETSGD